MRMEELFGMMPVVTGFKPVLYGMSSFFSMSMLFYSLLIKVTKSLTGANDLLRRASQKFTMFCTTESEKVEIPFPTNEKMVNEIVGRMDDLLK